MPRAFLITHRRYNGTDEMFEETERDYSPERGVRLAEYSGGHPTSDGASECGSETSSECPEELYNLTKLAEVSLAAAAGTLIHPSNVIYEHRPTSPRCAQLSDKSARVLPPRTKQSHQPFPQIAQQQQQQHLPVLSNYDEDRQRGERTRLFFERIESERKILEKRSAGTVLEVRLPSPHRHRYPHHRPEENQSRVPSDGSFVNEGRFDASSNASSNSSNSSGSTASTGSQARRTNSTENSKSEDNEDHECPDCGKKYSTSSNLARHRQTHRSLGDKKARRCPHCDKVYVSMPAFSMHVRTHNQGCKCHYCGKCFSRPWLLQGHIRTHTGEKPFKCTICNKAFADKSNLRAHIQTHSNTKPHVCGRCGKAFALKSYLYKHEESSCMRAHHRSSAEKSSESSVESKSNSSASSPTTAASSPTSLSRVQAPCVTASPTSVIVPRLDLNRDQRTSSSAFSAIIRHTRTPEANSASAANASPSKRMCRERTPTDERKSPDPDYVSGMVIRTSVISPNPERLGRFASEAKRTTSTYDFSESSRTSAFARPTTMTLNLAIA